MPPVPQPIPSPIEVGLVEQVKGCRTCAWFWNGTKPYGPYPSFDWLTDYPPEVVRNESQTIDRLPPQPWLAAKVIGSGFQDPGIMHGCRKAPIMTIGINPNMTAWFPYTSSAPWIYPGFSSAARYAYYYRHFTLYQESLSLDYVRERLSKDEKELLRAEDDGYVVGSSRENSHNYMELTVRYPARNETKTYDFAWAPDERWVIVQNNGYDNKLDTWFKKDAVLAGRFDPPKEGTAEISENAAGYYQRMVPVLDRFKKLTNLEGANLTIGEDIAQHDMVACASPGWQIKFDMPMDRIAANCVSHHGWMVAQFVQSQPAFVVLVSISSLNMFRSVFGPYMTMKSEGDIYALLEETCRRPTYVTIDIGAVKFRSRVIVSPHFSYGDGFMAGSRMSNAAWAAFASDYRTDARLLIEHKCVTPDPKTDPGPYLVNLPKDDALRAHLSISSQEVLNGYFFDPFQLMAEAMAQEYAVGTITFDAKTGHLRRGNGPCHFCVNDKWQFPEGCAYGKPNEKPLPPDELQNAVAAILAKAKEVEAARAAAALQSHAAQAAAIQGVEP